MTKTTPPAPVCDLPADQFFETLTGFDEVAITAKFSTTVTNLIGNKKHPAHDPLRGGRALVFVHRRRGGDKDPDAYKYAMGLSIRQVQDYFAPEPEAEDDEDPQTESGKDD